MLNSFIHVYEPERKTNRNRFLYIYQSNEVSKWIFTSILILNQRCHFELICIIIGPTKWGVTWRECKGENQSPVDLQHCKCIKKRFRLKFNNHGEQCNGYLINNGMKLYKGTLIFDFFIHKCICHVFQYLFIQLEFSFSPSRIHQFSTTFSLNMCKDGDFNRLIGYSAKTMVTSYKISNQSVIENEKDRFILLFNILY